MTIASADRSFSKLNLLKNYLKSSMSQERLRDMISPIVVDTIISDFASKNACRNGLIRTFEY